MSRISFSPVLKKKNTTDNKGYINVRVIYNRNSKYYPTGFNLDEKYWNEKGVSIETKLRTTKGFNSTLRTNIIDKVNEMIGELKITYRNNEDEPTNKELPSQSFLQSLKDHIKVLEERKQIGTSKRYKTTQYHIEKFLRKDNKTTLSFNEITSSFIEKFETYLLGLGLIKNTTKNYINSIKRLYTKCKGEGVFTTSLDPFVHFQNRRLVVKKEFLEKKHVECILMSKFENDDPLFNTRNYFLFQLFGQGLRVSDLLTLRFGNLVEGNFVFHQYKTKKEHTVFLTPTTIWILKDYIHSQEVENVVNTVHTYTFMSKKYSNNFNEIKIHYSEVSKSVLSSIISKKESPYTIDNVEKLKKIMDNTLSQMSEKLLILIHNYSKKHKRDFIFPIVNPTLYKDVEFNEHTTLTKKQYNHLQTILYNRSLKKLQEEVNNQSKNRNSIVFSPIDIVLTTHIPRHTYTNLMLDFGGDVYEISKSLGHQNLHTTDKYINVLKNKIENKNKDLGNSFSSFI